MSILNILTLLFLASIPLKPIFKLFPHVELPFYDIQQVLIVGLTLLLIHRKKFSVKDNYLIFWALFISWHLLTSIFIFGIRGEIKPLLTLLKGFWVYTLLNSLMEFYSRDKILKHLALFTIIPALFGLAQVLTFKLFFIDWHGLDPFHPSGIGYRLIPKTNSIFGDHQIYSYHILLLLPYFLLKFHSERKFLWLIFIVTVIFAQITTYSRAGYLALLFMTFVIALFAIRELKGIWKYLTFVISTLILIMGLAYLHQLNPISNREHIKIWGFSFNLILGNPIFGYGFQGVKEIFGIRVPESLLLQISLASGIIGFILFFTPILHLTISSILRKNLEKILFLGAFWIFSFFMELIWYPLTFALLSITKRDL